MFNTRDSSTWTAADWAAADGMTPTVLYRPTDTRWDDDVRTAERKAAA